MSTHNNICNDAASKSNNDIVFSFSNSEVNKKLQNMSLNDNNIFHFGRERCANCGKEGSDVTKNASR